MKMVLSLYNQKITKPSLNYGRIFHIVDTPMQIKYIFRDRNWVVHSLVAHNFPEQRKYKDEH